MCTYILQLPVLPAWPVKPQGHTYANQVLPELPNTTRCKKVSVILCGLTVRESPLDHTEKEDPACRVSFKSFLVRCLQVI